MASAILPSGSWSGAEDRRWLCRSALPHRHWLGSRSAAPLWPVSGSPGKIHFHFIVHHGQFLWLYFISIDFFSFNSNQFKSIQAISSCDRVCGKFLIGRSSSLSVRLWRPIDGVQQGTSLMMNNSTYSMLNRHWLFFQNHFWNLNLVENHPINILIVY